MLRGRVEPVMTASKVGIAALVVAGDNVSLLFIVLVVYVQNGVRGQNCNGEGARWIGEPA